MNNLLAVPFYVALLLFSALFLAYLILLTVIYDDGDFRLKSKLAILEDLQEERFLDEYLALGELQRQLMADSFRTLRSELAEVAEAPPPSTIRLVAHIIADPPTTTQVQDALQARSGEVNAGALARFEKARERANALRLSSARRLLTHAATRERIRLWRTGVADNIWKGAYRHGSAAVIVQALLLLVLAVTVLSVPGRIDVTSGIVSLVGVLALILSLSASPARVLWSSARRVFSDVYVTLDEKSKRQYRRLRFFFPLILIAGSLILVLRPTPVVSFGPEFEPPAWVARVMAALIACLLGYSLLVLGWQTVRRVATSRPPLTLGSLEVRRSVVDASGRRLRSRGVPMPLSRRLSELALLAFLTATFVGPIAGAALVASGRLQSGQDAPISPRLGYWIVGVFMIGFLSALILVIGAGMAGSLERRRRHEDYRAAGIDVKKVRNPLVVGMATLVAFPLTLVFQELIESSGAETPPSRRAEAAAMVEVLLGLGWTVWLLLLMIWWPVQALRLRRQDALLANQARLKRQSKTVEQVQSEEARQPEGEPAPDQKD